jgi:hypothetical protein
MGMARQVTISGSLHGLVVGRGRLHGDFAAESEGILAFSDARLNDLNRELLRKPRPDHVPGRGAGDQPHAPPAGSHQLAWRAYSITSSARS